MTLDEECKGCLFNSQMKKVERSAPDEKKLVLFKSRVAALCANPPEHYCAPLLMRDIDGIHRDIFGTGIDYSKEKRMFNSAVLGMEDELLEMIKSSSDPLAQAIKYAAAANYIDFAKLSDLNEGSIAIVKEAAAKAAPDPATLALFKERLKAAIEAVEGVEKVSIVYILYEKKRRTEMIHTALKDFSIFC